jgi:hypothetical protein
MITLDLMGGYARSDEQAAIQEAAAAGLRGMEHLVSQLSRAGTGESDSSSSPPELQHHQPMQEEKEEVDCREVTDMTVSKFKKVISMLSRTGHARFRRGPVVAQSEVSESAKSAPAVTLDFTAKQLAASGARRNDNWDNASAAGFSVSGGTGSSFLSLSTSVTGDGSVSNGRGGGSTMMLPPAHSRPPLSSGAGQKRRCHDHAHSENLAGATGGRCHCSKRR